MPKILPIYAKDMSNVKKKLLIDEVRKTKAADRNESYMVYLLMFAYLSLYSLIYLSILIYLFIF